MSELAEALVDILFTGLAASTKSKAGCVVVVGLVLVAILVLVIVVRLHL